MNRLSARGVHFTERDVVEAASMPNWTQREFIKAARAAYTVLQSDYRRGRLARFGPVSFNGIIDYVRNDAKIVYTSADKGPALVETPNGIFHQMLAVTDEISAVGRRPGIDRDDFTAWDQQGTHEAPRPSEDRPARPRKEEYDEAALSRLTDLLVPRIAAKLGANLTASVE